MLFVVSFQIKLEIESKCSKIKFYAVQEVKNRGKWKWPNSGAWGKIFPLICPWFPKLPIHDKENNISAYMAIYEWTAQNIPHSIFFLPNQT